MKKKIFSILAVIVASLTCFNVVGCDSGTNVDIKAQDYTDAHYVEGTLHKINVSESSVPFIKAGGTQYSIYVDTSSDATKTAITKSANYINSQIISATQVSLSVIDGEPVDYSTNSYAIIYGFQDGAFKTAGLTMPEDDIGTTGYYIKTVGNSVFIEAYGAEGYHLGGLAFLRYVLGYDMLSEDCIVYDRTPSTMPSMDIVERPDFDYRQMQDYLTQDEIYGMGLQSHSEIWIPVNGWDMHNCLYYIPFSTYGKDHPGWYNNSTSPTQPCYTAHGNKEEREEMLQAVANVMIQRLKDYPTLENISFSQMDGSGDESCTCSYCEEYEEAYGTPTSSTIDFINDLNDIVQAEFAGSGRTINIVFFAYHYSEPAPVITNADGSYSLYKCCEKEETVEEGATMVHLKKDASGNFIRTDVDFKCADNVFPWLAPIYAKYVYSFYNDTNLTYSTSVKKWNVVSKKVYLWVYGTDFTCYLYPYNTWSASVETYRYLKSCGITYVWDEGQENTQTTATTAFTHLKDYIDSKFLFNVNLNYNEVIDNYFDNYYLEASESMKNLFNLIQAQTYYFTENSTLITGHIYDDIANKKLWPRQLIETMLNYIDQAYEAVAKYASTNPLLYTKLVKRIKQESIFPRLVLCDSYAEYYSNIQEMRLQFKNDCVELGYTLFKEADGDLQKKYDAWGV